MSTGLLRHGDRAAREVSARFAGYFATTTTLAALTADCRADGMVAMAGSKLYVFNATATAGGVTPSTGTGRWLEQSGPTILVRGASAAALAANTRTGNVLTADANGALGTIDGLTAVVGEKFLIKDEATGANRGVYVVTSLGGASAKWTMTRAPEMDATNETLSGTLVVVSEGTANADRIFALTTNDPITLNSTSLTFTVQASLLDLAATTTPGGASLVGFYDAASEVTATEVNGAIAELAVKAIHKKTVHISHGDLTGASDVTNLGTALPTNAVVLAHEIDITEQFAGEGDCSIIIGGTDTDAIVAATDLDALAIGKYSGTLGAHPVGRFSAEQMVVTVTATALGDLTAGEMDITVWYVVLA